MRSLQLADRLSNAVVQKNLMDSRNTINRTRWQIIYLIQIGNIHSAELLSRLVDLSVHSMRPLQNKALKKSIDFWH